MATRHIMESRGRDVVGLAFTNQGVVLEKVLNLRLIAFRLRMENLLCFRPRIVDFGQKMFVQYRKNAGNQLGYIFELQILPQGLASSRGQLIASGEQRAWWQCQLTRQRRYLTCHTCQHHQLAPMSVAESMLALPSEDVGGNLGNILV